jgi:hypothetical protein
MLCDPVAIGRFATARDLFAFAAADIRVNASKLTLQLAVRKDGRSEVPRRRCAPEYRKRLERRGVHSLDVQTAVPKPQRASAIIRATAAIRSVDKASSTKLAEIAGILDQPCSAIGIARRQPRPILSFLGYGHEASTVTWARPRSSK